MSTVRRKFITWKMLQKRLLRAGARSTKATENTRRLVLPQAGPDATVVIIDQRQEWLLKLVPADDLKLILPELEDAERAKG